MGLNITSTAEEPETVQVSNILSRRAKEFGVTEDSQVEIHGKYSGKRTPRTHLANLSNGMILFLIRDTNRLVAGNQDEALYNVDIKGAGGLLQMIREYWYIVVIVLIIIAALIYYFLM